MTYNRGYLGLPLNTEEITVIDAQHESICVLIKTIMTTSNSLTIDDVLKHFTDLVILIETHFDYEESIMRKENYFDIKGHKLAHRHFFRLINNATIQVYESKSKDEIVSFTKLIESFARDHLDIEDKLLRMFLLQNYTGKFYEVK
jgi:hemerythrin-like metal-binding protein